MNIGQIKFISWISAGALTVGLSYYVWDYVAHMAARNQQPDPKHVKQVLEDVEPLKVKSEEVVAYGDIKRLFHTSCSECKTNPACRHLNWTGKEKEKPKPPDETTKEPPKVKVEELISVLMVKADMSDRKSSSIFFKYKNKATNVGLTNNGPAGGFLLKEGEHLGAPYDKIRLDEITGTGAWFAFEGETTERPREQLMPGAFDVSSIIVIVGPGGVVMPKPSALIPKTTESPFSSEHTFKRGDNDYQIGTKDAEYFTNNYQEELARNLETQRHQDPRTGKYDGIEITRVTGGSIAAQNGAQEGDVIKSINGSSVTSPAEAIHFVKTHPGETTWVVVIDSKGVLKTVTYHSP
jgi:PDZ domain